MARPRKNTVDYFPHDCKLGKTAFILEEKYGNDGYSFWFKLLETLGDTENHFIDMSNLTTKEYMGSKMHLSPDKVEEFFNLLSALDVIDKELWIKKIVWCQKFVDRISDVYTRNRHIETPSKPNIYTDKLTAEGVSTQINPQRKVKESKVKESKVKESKVKERMHSDNAENQEKTEPYKPETDIQKIITGYKIVKGVDKDDRAWDRLYYKRFVKPAKSLLAFIGSGKEAIDCIQDIGEGLDKKGLSWTLETVVKWASDWKSKKITGRNDD